MGDREAHLTARGKGAEPMRVEIEKTQVKNALDTLSHFGEYRMTQSKAKEIGQASGKLFDEVHKLPFSLERRDTEDFLRALGWAAHYQAEVNDTMDKNPGHHITTAFEKDKKTLVHQITHPIERDKKEPLGTYFFYRSYDGLNAYNTAVSAIIPQFVESLSKKLGIEDYQLPRSYHEPQQSQSKV